MKNENEKDVIEKNRMPGFAGYAAFERGHMIDYDVTKREIDEYLSGDDDNENLSLTDGEKTLYVLEQFEGVFSFVELYNEKGRELDSDVLCDSNDPDFKDKMLKIVKEYYDKNR